MVDNFSIAIAHALLALAIWRLMLRDDLDRDPGDDSMLPKFGRKPPKDAD